MRSVDVDINNVKISSKGLKCYFYYWAKGKLKTDMKTVYFYPTCHLGYDQ